jgi:hypothetical protein
MQSDILEAILQTTAETRTSKIAVLTGKQNKPSAANPEFQ